MAGLSFLYFVCYVLPPLIGTYMILIMNRTEESHETQPINQFIGISP